MPVIFTIILVLGSLATSLPAGTSAPFSQTTITVELGNRQGHNIFDDYWQSGTLTGLSLTMPFYFGYVQGGFQSIPFETNEPPVPRFQSMLIYVGWGSSHPVINNVSIAVFFRLGMDVMTFPNAEEYANYESELAINYLAMISYSPRSAWTVDLAWLNKRVFTQKHIALQYATISLGRTFETPRWLKEIME